MTDTTTDPPEETPAETPAESGASITARLEAEVVRLDAELTEIDMLIGQARAEAARHEQKRVAAAEKMAAQGTDRTGAEVADSAAQLLALTRRALLMEGQVELLDAKRRATARHRAALADIAQAIAAIPVETLAAAAVPDAVPDAAGVEPEPVVVAEPPAVTEPAVPSPAPAGGQLALPRMVLAAQEELRRDIARAMHDGPAQSLTNIMLQAQIVERLLDRSPADVRAELRQLVGMTQRTLDTTKTFIFDIRPMVLDDLGLVPTLRRTARERGRRAQVAVELESMGADRRLSTELESAVFRILDEALAAFLAQRPDLVRLELDWADALEAKVTAYRSPASDGSEELPSVPEGEVPAVIKQMIQDRHDARAEAVAAALLAAVITLPDDIQRDLVERATAVGAALEIREGGGEVRLVVGFHESGVAHAR